MEEGVQTMSEKSCPWFLEINKSQWYALFAGFMGWGLDAFDVMLYAFALTSIMKEWSINTAILGLLASLTLLSSAVGGIIWGIVADKIGRKKALMSTVLIFSICSGLSGLSHDIWQLAIARTLLGLGMGGEWATGALLVSESWPSKHRGKAIGIMQSGWAIGYFLAALVASYVIPAYGWRVLFFIGILPALFIFYVTKFVDEPKIWIEKTDKNRAFLSSFIEIFKPYLFRFTIVTTLISSAVMFAYWGLFVWLPGFLSSPVEKGGAGLSIVKSSNFMMPTMLGAFLGYVSFGFIADRLGRRPTFSFYLIISAVLVYIYGHTRDANTLMLLGPFLGFFGSGYFSGFGAFISELFPTKARGAGVGFTYNTGRALSAFAPTVVGYFAISYGLGASLTITSLFFLLGAILIFFLPETKGKELQ